GDARLAVEEVVEALVVVAAGGQSLQLGAERRQTGVLRLEPARELVQLVGDRGGQLGHPGVNLLAVVGAGPLDSVEPGGELVEALAQRSREGVDVRRGKGWPGRC